MAIPPGRELAMVEAILHSPDMESAEPNYLVFAKLEAVQRGLVYEERVRLFTFEAQAEPLDDMTERTEMEVTS